MKQNIPYAEKQCPLRVVLHFGGGGGNVWRALGRCVEDVIAGVLQKFVVFGNEESHEKK